MKYRVHAKNTNIIIKGKPAFGEKINERELDYLLKNTVPGFFHISYDGKKQLEYEAPAALPLAKYLKDEKLDEQSFWKVMAQMVDAQIAAKSRGLYPDHILTKPDMVFMDITMPNMDGLQALKKIKEGHADARIVMCTAMGQQSMVVEAIKYGAKDFIVKPFNADRIVEAVNSILG